MMLLFLIAITFLYGYVHFGTVEWIYLWLEHFRACSTATILFFSIFGIGQQIYQYILSISVKVENEQVDTTDKSSASSNWDVVLFLGLGGVGIWNALCFWFSVPILGYVPIFVSIFLFYKNMETSISCFKYIKTLIQKSKVLVICLVLWGLISALGPILDTDAIYYHIAIPKKMWLYERTFGGFLHPNGSRPLLIPSIDAILFSCGDHSSIAVFRLWMGIAMLLSFVHRGCTKFGLLLMLGSMSFLQEFGIYGYNLMAAFGVWLSYHTMNQRNNPIIVGILAGITLSIKYTTLGPLLAIWCIALPLFSVDRNVLWQYRMKSLIPVVTIVILWPLRNLIEGLHPLFPYVGWSEQFQMLEKYGMGRDWNDFLLLPYNILVHAKPYSDQFLGRIHPLWALGLPTAILTKQYRLLAICIVSGVFWAMGPHWIRHLIIFLPLCALLFQTPKRSIMQWIWVVYFIFLPWQLSNSIVDLEDRIRSVFEQSKSEQLQERRTVGWNTALWIKENTPKDAKIAFFYSWTGLGTERFFLLGSVEEHIPTREWLTTHRDRSLRDLQELGINFVVVGPAPKYKAGWSFLQKTDFEERFMNPQKILQNCLLRDAVMIYEHKGFALYRIRK